MLGLWICLNTNAWGTDLLRFEWTEHGLAWMLMPVSFTWINLNPWNVDLHGFTCLEYGFQPREGELVERIWHDLRRI